MSNPFRDYSDTPEPWEVREARLAGENRRFRIFMSILALCGVLLIVWGASMAEAHQAPTGWAYDRACCSNRDCGEVPADWIEEGPQGILIKPTGELINYSDSRVRISPDGRKHWCRNPNTPNPRTICVYLPSRGF